MSRKIKKIIQLCLATNLLLTNSDRAYSLETITSVHQLKKLQNTNRDYQDLQYLSRRYQCATKFINNKNRPVTRYEFAAAINSCGQKLENSSNFQDLAIWHSLKQNYALELTQLKTKIEQITARTNQLESQQFSTTTKLKGQVLFFIADSFAEEDSSQTFSGYRIRLDLNTSFSGQDLLKVRLESRDVGRLDDVTDTLLSRSSVDGTSEDKVEIAELSYTFLTTDSTAIVFGTTGVGLNDIGEVLNPFSSSSKGAISRFGRRNPATLRSSGGAGIGIRQKISDRLQANVGYLIDSNQIASPEAGNGLFDSSATAIAQVVFQPREELKLALTYTHAYQREDDVNLMGSTGLEESNRPFGDNATTSDNFGLQINWEVSSNFLVGGWFGYTTATQQQNGDDNATILNGALTLAFPDLWAENNEGGIIIGVPPTISEHDDSSVIAQSTPIHIEALYRIELSDQIQITPGAFMVFNSDSDDGDTIWVGVIRTLFSF